MAGNSQRDAINDLQIQMAGFGKDIEYLKRQADSTDKKLDLAIESISHLAFVPLNRFEEYQHMLEGWRRTTERRLKALEDYNEKNSVGVWFSNGIVSYILKALIAIAAVSVLIAAGKIIVTHQLLQGVLK